MDKSIKRNGLNIILQNIRSVNRNVDAFFLTLQSLDETLQDVIAVTETWSKLGNIPYISGYQVFENSSDLNKSSGVGMIIKNIFEPERYYTNVEKLNRKTMDIVTARIRTHKYQAENDTIIISTIYRSPNINKEHFINDLKEIMEELQKGKKKAIIMGDMNINTENKNNSYFKEVINNSGYRIINSVTTRKGKNRGSVLDLILTNIMCNTSTDTLETHITDHNTILSNFDIQTNDNDTKNEIKKEKVDYKNVIKNLEKTDFSMALNLENPNNSLRYIIEIINREIKENTKLLLIKHKRYEGIKQPWMENSILKSLRKKNKMKNKLNRNPDNKILENKYKKYRNIFNSITKNLKRKHFDLLLQKNENNPKKTWEIINNLMDRKDGKLMNGPKVLRDENKRSEIINDKEIANYANCYYTRMEEEEINEIEIKSFLKQEKSTIFMEPISENEMRNNLRMLSSSTAVGYDKISNKLLKNLPNLVNIVA